MLENTNPSSGAQPTGDTGGGAASDDTGAKDRKWRDDLYRRQSQLEQTMTQSIAELKGMLQGITQNGGGGSPREPEPQFDMEEYQALAKKDPARAMLMLSQHQSDLLSRQFEEKMNQKLSETTTRQETTRILGHARNVLLDKYPELREPEEGGMGLMDEVERIYSRKLRELGLPEPSDTDPAKYWAIDAAVNELRNSRLQQKKGGIEASKDRARQIAQQDDSVPQGSPAPTGDEFIPTPEQVKIGKKMGLDMESEKGRATMKQYLDEVDRRIDPAYKQPRE